MKGRPKRGKQKITITIDDRTPDMMTNDERDAYYQRLFGKSYEEFLAEEPMDIEAYLKGSEKGR